MNRELSLFRFAETEAHGEGRVHRAHGARVEAAHALAQPGFIQRADLLKQDHAVPVEPDARPAEIDMRREPGLPGLAGVAAAITVGLWRLPVSFCTISTGRIPPCSLPTTGLRSAK